MRGSFFVFLVFPVLGLLFFFFFISEMDFVTCGLSGAEVDSV